MPNQNLAGRGFASGFVGALANAFGAKQDRARQAEQQKRQQSLSLAQLLINSGQVPSIEAVQPLLAHAMPDIFDEKAAKKGAKGGINPAQTIGDILNKSLGSSQGQPLLPGPAATQKPLAASPAPAGDTLQPGVALDTGAPPAAPAALSSSPVSIPGAQPQRRMLAGVPLLSPEEVAQRKLSLDIGAEQAQIEAKVALARRILPTLQAVDKSATLDDALATVGIRTPRTQGVPSFSEIPGEVVGADGKRTPVTGIIDHRTGQIIDPITREPIRGFIRRATGGANDLGDLAERAAISLGFPSAQAAGAAGRMADVNKKVAELAAETSGARTTASTEARTTAEAKAPLSTEQRVQTTINLRDQWFQAQRPVTIVRNQLGNMEVGLKRFLEGDKVGGANAVLTTFQRILDPETGVREAEYDRLPGGLGLKQRIEGFVEKLSAGGAGIPDEEMKAIVQTARELADNFESYNDVLKDAIQTQVKEEKLTERMIFGAAPPSEKKETGGGKTTPTGTTPAAPGITMDKDGNIYVNGVKQKF